MEMPNFVVLALVVADAVVSTLEVDEMAEETVWKEVFVAGVDQNVVAPSPNKK